MVLLLPLLVLSAGEVKSKSRWIGRRQNYSGIGDSSKDSGIECWIQEAMSHQNVQGRSNTLLLVTNDFAELSKRGLL